LSTLEREYIVASFLLCFHRNTQTRTNDDEDDCNNGLTTNWLTKSRKSCDVAYAAKALAYASCISPPRKHCTCTHCKHGPLKSRKISTEYPTFPLPNSGTRCIFYGSPCCSPERWRPGSGQDHCQAQSSPINCKADSPWSKTAFARKGAPPESQG
jgi:hypothetical protein